MPTKWFVKIGSIFILALISFLASGCSPSSPIPYQTLQIQDSQEAAGYDVYMYVAVEKGLPEGDVTGLLEWFRDVKFPEENKIKIFVWDNPQSALISAMGDMVASLEVDREAGVNDIRTYASFR